MFSRQVPTGTTANGKTPPLGKGDPDGTAVILPALHYGSTKNEENPELYVAFPYRLYGVGKPDLKLAQDSFAARKFPQDTCWGQDGPQAAILGLTVVAQKAASTNLRILATSVSSGSGRRGMTGFLTSTTVAQE